MRARRVAEDALLIECSDDRAVRAAYAEALRRRETGELICVDIVPAARTVLLDGVQDRERVLASVEGWSVTEVAIRDAPLVEVPVRYDGPDLDDVAALWDVDVAEVVRRHRETDYTVAFCGFAPGFVYLSGLPEEWSVPRLEDPRTKVPAGSVGLASSYTGIYPRSSPGGWRLIGRTELSLWDLQQDPPARLPPGTRVRFVDA